MGRARWTLELLADTMAKLTEHESLSGETVRRRLAENHLKPWRKDMWCIPRIDGEYVARMEDVLDLYAEAPDPTLIRRRIEGYVATGRQKHGTKAATTKRKLKSGTLIARMSTKLKRAGYRSRYRLRKQIVEPVFGQIKQARGFRQFLLRSIDKVKAEWAMICTAHNLAKLAAAR